MACKRVEASRTFKTDTALMYIVHSSLDLYGRPNVVEVDWDTKMRCHKLGKCESFLCFGGSVHCVNARNA